jgi:hypothetical protein
MMKQQFKNAKRASILLLTIFFLSSLTIFIQSCGDDGTELPAVTASFTETVNNTTGEVTFKNTSTNATIYAWNLGDGTTSTQFEPKKTYQTGKYTVKLTASNTAGGTASAERTFDVTLPGPPVDTTKPIITLVGDATINLTVGDPYTDKGATATDNLDGTITAKIVKGGGTVNTTSAGTFTITYDVTDLAGNAAVRVTRTVIVTAFDDGLLENGAFSIENGKPGAAWSGNAFNVINEGGTNFNFANVATAGDAFAVNLQQVLPLVQGKNYILTFEASSGAARTMVAGIGLSVDPWTNTTKIVNLTTAKQTFTLELSAAAFGGANSRVIFDMGAAVGTVVIDNVKLVEGAPTPCAAETLENINPASGNINWTFKTNSAASTFEPFGNIASAIVTNPKLAGINTSCNVQKYTKTGGCETWSGVGKPLQAALDFGVITNKAFKMKVLAENQVTDVTLRLERLPFPDTEPSKEKVATITKTGEWQELTFDFSDVTSGTFKSMIIYFDRNQPCDGDVYYFDDIIQVAGAGGGGGGTPGTNLAANGDFENGTTGWMLFQNGGTAAIDNTVNNGGTKSGKLTTGGASNPAFKQERIGAGTVKGGDVVRIKFDHKGTVVPPGGVLNVLLFGEGAAGASFTHVFSPAPTLGSTFTTFTGTFTIGAGVDVSQGISFLIEAVCGGDAGCSVTANIDNVSVVLNP